MTNFERIFKIQNPERSLQHPKCFIWPWNQQASLFCGNRLGFTNILPGVPSDQDPTLLWDNSVSNTPVDKRPDERVFSILTKESIDDMGRCVPWMFSLRLSGRWNVFTRFLFFRYNRWCSCGSRPFLTFSKIYSCPFQREIFSIFLKTACLLTKAFHKRLLR